MLYYLFRSLAAFGIPGAHIWSYISFRSLLVFVLALMISAWYGEWFIRRQKQRAAFEQQRDASIDPYGVEKRGVPTMGGLIIIVATVIPALLLGRLRNVYMLILLGTTLWLGLLGYLDDWTKMHRTKDGIRPTWKLLGQAVLGLTVGLVLWLSPDAVVYEQASEARVDGVEVVQMSEPVKSTVTTIPFVKNNNLHYWSFFRFLGENRRTAGWVLFVLVTTFVVMAVSNGANLNDGMDGMCAGNAAIMCATLAVLAYVSSHIGFASYLNIMYVPGSEEVVVFLMAFVGALIGFLWYNAYPAQVFMGDTGSLAIGGIIAVTAVIIHKELMLPLICFIFLMESVSVLAQTNYARYGNRRGLKLRVIKRAPLHDTFRVRPGQLPADFRVLINWPKGCWLESKITTRFWIITLMACALAIVTLKIR